MPGTRSGRSKRGDQMQATVTKKFKIQAAHFLPDYKGKCAHMHGHQWDISISVSGPINSEGFVIDFSDLKRLIVTPLEDMFDHKILNDCCPFKPMEKGDDKYWRQVSPTAENLAEFILEFSVVQLAKYLDLWVSEVSVAETEDNIATVRQDPFKVDMGRLLEKKDAVSA